MRLRLLMFCLLVLLLVPAMANTQAEKHPGMREFAAELAGGDEAQMQAYLAVLEQADYKDSIIKAMTRPAESKPWYKYRPIFLTDERIQGGQRFAAEHAELLQQAEAKYGVPGEFVVSIIGVETFYGRITGTYRVLDALATLAFYYPPRAPYFRGELGRFLRLPGEHGIGLDLTGVKGSYAGAMGWGQFMPTSYATWAVDGDEDGQIDLWNSTPDIIFSVANYLAEHGWVAGEPVKLALHPIPGAREIEWQGADPVYPLAQLVEWGYQPDSVSEPDRLCALLSLELAEGHEHYATFANFKVITRYNRSPMYAMAVTQLAEAIAAGDGTPAP
ncbi:MAG: lytic murein transglycosylase B [Xanthomonadales bacterium]|nr:lytic murein transglycosylase B [Xanthomonadales bacterium]